MVTFAESAYAKSMKSYETACSMAKIGPSRTLAQQIEDELVSGGVEVVRKYRSELEERHKLARCLAEYDGIAAGFAIVKRAVVRLEQQNVNTL